MRPDFDTMPMRRDGGDEHIKDLSQYKSLAPKLTCGGRCQGPTVVCRQRKVRACGRLYVRLLGLSVKLFGDFFYILYNDQQMHYYFTNYHIPTCFDTVV